MNAGIAIVLSALGWLMGMGVNLCADQLPITGNLSKPTCSRCGASRQWGHFLVMKKCGSCQASRSIRSWTVQIAYCLLIPWAWFVPSDRLPFGMVCLLAAYFGLVSLIDLEHRLVLGPLSLVGLGIGLICGYELHGWLSTFLGGGAGALIMLAIYWLGRLFSRWMIRRRGQQMDEEALGLGDVYIAAILGLILGWPGITAGLIVGIFLGGLVSGLVLAWMFIRRQYRPFMALPYAPFLIAAALLLLFRPA